MAEEKSITIHGQKMVGHTRSVLCFMALGSLWLPFDKYAMACMLCDDDTGLCEHIDREEWPPNLEHPKSIAPDKISSEPFRDEELGWSTTDERVLSIHRMLNTSRMQSWDT